MGLVGCIGTTGEDRVKRLRSSERGASAVEAALVTPLLLLLVFGIVEMSMLMRDTVATTSSVRTGARTASVSAGAGPGTCQASANPPPCSPANAPALAQAAADAIQRAGSAMPKNNIRWLMVYDANTSGYPLPAGNTNLSCVTKCVTYVWDAGLNKFRYASGSWTSSTINACVNDPAREAVGIAMLAHHPMITGLFGRGVDITERSVMQFEPLTTDTCQAGAHS